MVKKIFKWIITAPGDRRWVLASVDISDGRLAVEMDTTFHGYQRFGVGPGPDVVLVGTWIPAADGPYCTLWPDAAFHAGDANLLAIVERDLEQLRVTGWQRSAFLAFFK